MGISSYVLAAIPKIRAVLFSARENQRSSGHLALAGLRQLKREMTAIGDVAQPSELAAAQAQVRLVPDNQAEQMLGEEIHVIQEKVDELKEKGRQLLFLKALQG